MKKILYKTLSIILIFSIYFSSFTPLLGKKNPIIKNAYAENVCSAGIGNLSNYLSTRVGGVTLDEAAVFLADMSDITGAYYDADQDRVVFVGTKGSTSVPKFDKDDLAVAIRALVFRNEIPSVSMEIKDPNNMFGDTNLNVLYYGGIEDTRFGQVLVEADYKMKQYAQGYDVNSQKIVSTVPGYKSHWDRFLEKNPDPGKSSFSRWWISPKSVTLKKDDTAKSFVFDQVQMQIETEGLWSTNDPKWNEAAVEFAQQQTDLYDQFAQETPSYYQAKQLAKVVAVVKWIKDNNIVNNFEWARDYQPKYVSTPREIRRLTTPDRQIGNTIWRMTGGVTYDEPNVYAADGTQISTGLKNSSESVGTATEEVHWTFVNGGKTYDAVAVGANAFRSIGAYTTSSVDIEFPMAGDLNLSFERDYSSFSGGQKGVGRGWDFMPARLYDNKTGWYSTCSSGLTGSHPYKLGFTTSSGLSETFTFTSCSTGYSSDSAEYNSKLTHNTDGTFTIRLTDQTEFIFDSSFRLISIRDKNANTITYSYNSSGKLSSIKDTKGHELALSYNSSGLLASVNDWTGRKVQYGYDAQSNLVNVTDPKGGVMRYEYDSNNKLTKVINRLGQVVTENTYTPESKIATQKDSGGSVVSFNYDESTRTVNASDNLGRTGKVVYDTKARITSSTDALNNPISYTYGSELAPLTVTDKRGYKTTFTYDTAGNLTSLTLPTSKKITYTYDSLNRLTRISDGRYGFTSKVTNLTYNSTGDLTAKSEAGLTTNYTYDSSGEMLSLTNPLNQKTTWTRDAFGNPLTVVDPLNNTTTFVYDSLSRKTSEQDAESKSVTYTYDLNNNLESRTDTFGPYRYSYDAENRVIKETKPNLTTTEYTYNQANGLTSVKDSMNNLTSYGYDSYKNLISQQNALSQTSLFSYDKMNQPIQSTTPQGKIAKWEYDKSGNITKTIDANGNAILYTYDNLNRVTQKSYPNSSSVTYSYDDRNNLIRMTDTIGTTTYTYDTFDRLTKVTNPYSRSISYSYDSADNLTKITYPDGKAVTYSYDSSNQLKSVSDWNSNTTTYSYFKNGLLQSKLLPNGISGNYLYDGSNKLMGLEYIRSGVSLAKFSYVRDNLGNITKVTEEGSYFSGATPTPTPTPTVAPTNTPTPTPTGTVPTPTPTRTPTPTPTSGVTPTPTPGGASGADLVITGITIGPNPDIPSDYDITVSFKNQGNVATTALSFRVGFYYDITNPPTPITITNDTEPYFNTVSPGETASVTQSLVDFTSGNHTVWAYVDQNLKVSETNESNNSSGPYNLTVAAINSQSFFAKLNIMPAITDIFTPRKVSAQTLPLQFNSNFSYDSLGRIVSAVYPDKSYSYTYDQVDNRISQNIAGQTTNYTYNSDSQLTSDGISAFTYNANGDLVTKASSTSTQSYQYDFDDRLTSFVKGGVTTTYQYDGHGNRIQKSVGGTVTRFVNDISGELENVLAETNSSNTIQKWYVYGASLISLGSSASSSRLYPLTDGIGNTRFVTNYSGDKVKQYEYDPFGNIRSSSGVNDSNYRFAGEQLDPESEMYYLRARYYEPSSGRFITRDPVMGDLARPQTQNPYAYALNNPNTYSDPSGEYVPAIIFLGGALTLGGLEVGGAICGGYNYLTSTSNPTLGGLGMHAAIGAQKAVESPIGQVALGAATLGLGMAANPPSKGKLDLDLSKSPGKGFIWKGSGAPGSSQGSWVNSKTGEVYHPDLNHPAPVGPHVDYTVNGDVYRIFPDGTIKPK